MPPVKKGMIKSFDGTELYYQIAGRGKEYLVCMNGIGVARWVWRPFEEYFADRFRIVTWDYRGHGLSEDPVSAGKVSFNDLIGDALSLLGKLKIDKAYLIGHSAGFHVALGVYNKKPSIARGLISCLGTSGRTLETFMDSFLGKLVFDVGYILNAVFPDAAFWINSSLLKNPATYHLGAALKLVNPAIDGKDEVNKYIRHFTGMDFSVFNQLAATETKDDATGILRKIDVPTLLIAAEHDKFVPLSVTRKMHQKIKGAELFVIKNGTHAALLEQPDIFNLVIEKFVT